MDYSFLKETSLFYGLNENEISELLNCMIAATKAFTRGSYVFRAGEHIHTIGLLISGQLSIESVDVWGNKTILNMLTPGNVFGENYVFLPDEELMINVVAVSDSTILFMDADKFITTCSGNCSFHNKIIKNLLAISAQKSLNLSRRSLHTASKTIRGRLLSYLSYESLKHDSLEFDIPFNRQQLADYLNLDRSALSKELGKMTKNGLLQTDHNHFVLSPSSLDEFI